MLYLEKKAPRIPPQKRIDVKIFILFTSREKSKKLFQVYEEVEAIMIHVKIQ